ncbi:dihydroorotate dehydrogenase [Caldiplasma sukawensis]
MQEKLFTFAGGLKLGNPSILASGILDENGYSMLKIMEDGAGAVVTKSIGMTERNGYESPVIYEGENYLLNAMGLPNPGIENYRNEIEIASKGGKPIIGSIFGSTEDEFLKIGEKMQDFGVNAIELNLSCPHVKGFGTEVGSDLPLVRRILKNLKGSLKIPVWAKLGPATFSYVDSAYACSDADAIVLINTVKAMRIDIRFKKPVLSNIYGGLSGSTIKPIGLRAVYEVKKETGMEVIGVGGITTWEDAVEYIMAGASAFQVGTAIWRKGREVFREINDGITGFMNKEGYHSIKDMVGVAME